MRLPEPWTQYQPFLPSEHILTHPLADHICIVPVQEHTSIEYNTFWHA
jgi:hypothetical protein